MARIVSIEGVPRSLEPAPVWSARQHGPEFIRGSLSYERFAGGQVDLNSSPPEIPRFVELGALVRADNITSHGESSLSLKADRPPRQAESFHRDGPVGKPG